MPETYLMKMTFFNMNHLRNNDFTSDHYKELDSIKTWP